MTIPRVIKLRFAGRAVFLLALTLPGFAGQDELRKAALALTEANGKAYAQMRDELVQRVTQDEQVFRDLADHDSAPQVRLMCRIILDRALRSEEIAKVTIPSYRWQRMSSLRIAQNGKALADAYGAIPMVLIEALWKDPSCIAFGDEAERPAYLIYAVTHVLKIEAGRMPIAPYLRSDQGRVRQTAAAALAELRSPESLRILVEYVEQPAYNDSTVLDVVEAAIRCGSFGSSPFLEQKLRETKSQRVKELVQKLLSESKEQKGASGQEGPANPP